VRFLVDAQLPARLANLLNERGHDAVHTTDLPDGNRSTDTQIAKFADEQDRVVVTNTDLLRLFTSHLEAMTNALSGADLVEIGTDSMVVHPRREPGQ
jgi:tetraacyldisaccharide-1-P 4'-kinase